jgi:acetyl esterase/lipase
VGEEDPLVSDTLQLAEKLSAAGVPCTVRQYPGLPHAYVMLSGMSATARNAVIDAARCAAEMLGAAASGGEARPCCS